jgi:hypothetical protein
MASIVFAGAGRADQEQVGLLPDERQVGEVVDELAVNGRLGRIP